MGVHCSSRMEQAVQENVSFIIYLLIDKHPNLRKDRLCAGRGRDEVYGSDWLNDPQQLRRKGKDKKVSGWSWQTSWLGKGCFGFFHQFKNVLLWTLSGRYYICLWSCLEKNSGNGPRNGVTFFWDKTCTRHMFVGTKQLLKVFFFFFGKVAKWLVFLTPSMCAFCVCVCFKEGLSHYKCKLAWNSLNDWGFF